MAKYKPEGAVALKLQKKCDQYTIMKIKNRDGLKILSFSNKSLSAINFS